MISLGYLPNGTLMFYAALTGLEDSTSGGIHIHEGFSCEGADLVGGHYYPGLDEDPWDYVMWQSNSDHEGMVEVDGT